MKNYSDRNKKEQALTALISMPFAPADIPSVQLGLLQSILNNGGISGRSFYYNMDFFLKLKKKRLHGIYNSSLSSLLSEWFFSPVNMELQPSEKKMLEEFALVNQIRAEDLYLIKNTLSNEFIEEIFNETDWSEYEAVAFTMTYAQIYPSFALAKKIKNRFPHIRTIFGGALSQIHHDSIPEYMKNFPFIDYFILGDAEPAFLTLIKAINDDNEEPRHLVEIPGLYFREGDSINNSGVISHLVDMEESPVPDYKPYFDKIRQTDPVEGVGFKKVIPIEMSRGCAWGEKFPCNFCAFYPCRNFRVKTSEQILEEMKTGIDNYGVSSFYVVDAAVTARMIEEIFSRFGQFSKKIRIPFIELRTNVGKNSMEILKNAGVKLAQPGVESLDGGLLKKMNKGVTVFNNLLFLKWCRQFDLGVSYNILLNIPNASADELKNQIRIIRMIPHLFPPYFMPVQLVRFSQYVIYPDKFGIRDTAPAGFYRHIHPAGIDIEKVAFEYSGTLKNEDSEIKELYTRTIQQIKYWQKRWIGAGEKPFLNIDTTPRRIFLLDGRINPEKPKKFQFSDLHRDIYMLCMDKPRNLLSIRRSLGAKFRDASEDDLRGVLDDFVNEDLMLEDKGMFLSLAVDKSGIKFGYM